MEIVDKNELGDIRCLKNEYEWLLDLSDEELSQKVIDTNDVQNALIELLRFVDDVLNLPVLETDVDGNYYDPRLETTDKWIDMNWGGLCSIEKK